MFQGPSIVGNVLVARTYFEHYNEVFLEDVKKGGVEPETKAAGSSDEPPKGRAPASMQDLKDPMTAMKNLGYLVGKAVKLKKNSCDGAQVFLIMGMSNTEVHLREVTWDHAPKELDVLPNELVKDFSLHRSALQVMMPEHNPPMANPDWEVDAFHAAIVLGMRRVMANTEFDPSGVKLFKSPYMARAAKGYAKGNLKMVAASTAISCTKRPAPSAIGCGTFETVDKKTAG